MIAMAANHPSCQNAFFAFFIYFQFYAKNIVYQANRYHLNMSVWKDIHYSWNCTSFTFWENRHFSFRTVNSWRCVAYFKRTHEIDICFTSVTFSIPIVYIPEWTVLIKVCKFWQSKKKCKPTKKASAPLQPKISILSLSFLKSVIKNGVPSVDLERGRFLPIGEIVYRFYHFSPFLINIWI